MRCNGVAWAVLAAEVGECEVQQRRVRFKQHSGWCKLVGDRVSPFPLRLGDIMVGWIKKVLLVLGIAFVVFYLFTRPEAAAEAIRTFFGAFESIARF